MHSTTTCTYSQPSIVWSNENDAYFDSAIGSSSYPAVNIGTDPFQFVKSECVTVSDSSGGGGGSVSIDLDPLYMFLAILLWFVVFSFTFILTRRFTS